MVSSLMARLWCLDRDLAGEAMEMPTPCGRPDHRGPIRGRSSHPSGIIPPAASAMTPIISAVGSGGVCTVDDVVEFLSWGLSVQDDAGSAVEAVLDGLDLGVGDGGEAGALGEVFADQAVGVLGRVKRWRHHSRRLIHRASRR